MYSPRYSEQYCKCNGCTFVGSVKPEASLFCAELARLDILRSRRTTYGIVLFSQAWFVLSPIDCEARVRNSKIIKEDEYYESV